MTDKKEDNKKKIDVDVSVAYKNENPLVYKTPDTEETVVYNNYLYKPYTVKVGDCEYTFTPSFYDENEPEQTVLSGSIKQGLEFSTLTEMQKNGMSSEDIYKYLTNFLAENKNNPDVITGTVNNILDKFLEHYDNNKSFKKLDNQSETLDKVMNASEHEDISGLICGTIHGFMQKALNEAGIESVLVEGSNKGAHTTLLYKNPNGKYMFNNYQQSFEIDDPNITNIKDAIAYVNKYATLQSVGMLAIQDTQGHSYSEFAYKKEAPFGDEMDKRDGNALTPFNSNLPKKSNISASVEKSNIGNFSAKVGTTKLYQECGKDKASSFTVGYKKTVNRTCSKIHTVSA